MKTQLLIPVFAVAAFYGCKKDSNPVTPPAITTTEVSEISTTSAVSGGIVTSDEGAEITARGICWGVYPKPALSSGSRTIEGSGMGSFASTMTDLTENSTYYVRAYATNSAGTTYGNEISFKTIAVSALIPVVNTSLITSLTPTSISTGGVVTSDKGDPVIGRGICWGGLVDPTLSDNKTDDGSGTGQFTTVINGLVPGTTYYLRAYAINRKGTAYGEQFSFTMPVSGGTGLKKSNYPGGPRYNAAGFAIGTKVYIGLGYDQNDYSNKDFWEWDQSTDIWTKKADFPGNIDGYAASFAIGAKGYIGTGGNNNGASNEFWEYDPATNTWNQKSSLPLGAGRMSSIGFSIGTKGYLGLGVDVTGAIKKDFWEWDQATDVWTKKADFGGEARIMSVGFSIGTKGYIGTGSDNKYDNTRKYYNDFWEWDQATNVWTKKTDFGGNAGAGAIGFSIGNKGYIGLGTFGTQCWEWDQLTETWKRVADFQVSRGSAIGVSAGDKGYIGTGYNGYLPSQDFYEFNP